MSTFEVMCVVRVESAAMEMYNSNKYSNPTRYLPSLEIEVHSIWQVVVFHETRQLLTFEQKAPC